MTAPNQGEAFIGIRPVDQDQWLAALRATADGPDVSVTQEPFASRAEAWEAAFELYRIECIV